MPRRIPGQPTLLTVSLAARKMCLQYLHYVLIMMCTKFYCYQSKTADMDHSKMFLSDHQTISTNHLVTPKYPSQALFAGVQ